PCVFGAARPDGEAAFGLVLPEVGTQAVQAFLDAFAGTIPQDEHAVMVLDRGGWHGAKALGVPPNVTLVRPPPCSPQLDPTERVRLWLRERFLDLRVFPDFEAIVDACRHAWNAFADDPDRIRSLSLHPWIRKVISQARRYDPEPDRSDPNDAEQGGAAIGGAIGATTGLSRLAGRSGLSLPPKGSRKTGRSVARDWMPI
ncbi:MAG: transposase, partial [Paracoccaceae bacterium]